MSRHRHLAFAPLALALALPPSAAGAAELDPAAVAYKLEAVLQIVGEGPATGSPFVPR